MVSPTKIRSEKVRKAVQRRARYQSPSGGLNILASTIDFPVTDAYTLDNVIAKPNGCEIRRGYQEWIPLANKFSVPVRTILPYFGENLTNSELFAAPAEDPSNLYKITTQGAAPTLSLTPSTNSRVPGEWYYTNFVTIGGNFLLAVSLGAGYYSFASPAGVDTWTERINGAGVGQIQWPVGDTHTTKDIAFIWIWKNRVWFLVRDSATAYYLPISQISGLLSAFDFGQQLNAGGALLWATNWTYDSGAGMDDALVLASTEGQMLVYEGTDPDSAAAFRLKGRWEPGRSPDGRRSFADHGGDVLFISEYGLVSVADLVAGRLHAGGLTGGMAAKVNPLLAELVHVSSEQLYWHLTVYPHEEMLYLGTPVITSSGNNLHFSMNSLINTWNTFSGMDTLCSTTFNRKFIFGSSNGMVYQGFTGYRDNVSADGTSPGDQIIGRIQGAFMDLGDDNSNKRVLRIKVYGFSDLSPSFFAKFQPEYNLSSPISAPITTQVIGGKWDVAKWDVNSWSLGPGDGSFHQWFGVTGFGKKMSLQLAISGSGKTLYTDHEIIFETGIGL